MQLSIGKRPMLEKCPDKEGIKTSKLRVTANVKLTH